MFKLKRVELQGFKSFADRSRLEFGMGTAAIVGPNGCGKSNLSDAISWVLGEQSARMLRGDRMADVIFNGSGKRPPISMAEVSMTLVGAGKVSGILPARPGAALSGDTPEVTGGAATIPADAIDAAHSDGYKRLAGSSEEEMVVTRRLFRSGESEYLLNGRACRLRDIQDIFMGTGLGPESYAIIEQGRIGQILSSKPSDRRAIIEEAAGISKFKSRKRLAEAKLESARQNLARISDIFEEVSKQVNSLKRQASKAERYHQLHGEYRAKQRVVLASQLVQMQAGHDQLKLEHAGLQQECAESAHRLEEIERESRDLAARSECLEEQLKQARQRLAQGELEMERLHSRIEQARREAASLEKRATEANLEIAQLQKRQDSLQQEIADREKLIGEIGLEFASAQEAVAMAVARQAETTSDLSAAERQVESLRQTVLVAVSQAADLRNQLVQAEESGFAIDRQLARARTERNAAQAEHQALAADLAQLEQEHLNHSSAFSQLSQSASELSILLEKIRSQEAACHQKLEMLREEYSKASARKQALEESLARHAYSTDSVRKLLSAESNGNEKARGFRALGVLADFVEVTPGYEEVVEEFLRTELDSVVVEGHEEARQGLALVESEGSGRTAFFIQKFHSTGNGNGHTQPPMALATKPAGATAALGELMRFEPKLGLNGEEAFPALSSTYLVANQVSAEKLAEAYPQYHFLTLTGEHYHHRMVSGGKKASAGPLALRRDFRELDRRAADLNAAVGHAQSEWEELKETVRSYEEELAKLSAGRQDAEKQSLVAHEKLRQTKRALDSVLSRIKTLEQEAALLEEEKQRIAVRRAELESSLERGSEERARSESSLAKALEAARASRINLDRLGQELGKAQSSASGLSEKMFGAETDYRRLQNHAAETRERKEHLMTLTRALVDEIRQWQDEGSKAGERLDAVAQTEEDERASLQSLERQAAELRLRREEMDPRVVSGRTKLDACRERRSGAEVALARTESDLGHHIQRCRQELGLDPDALLGEVRPGQILEGHHLTMGSQEAEELRARMERLGPVNMMALDELREAEDRQTFLDTQRQDLLASINDTAQTIREIDHVSHRQFREAFQAINGFFSDSFRTLFGGGSGEMRLSDETDPESGIDIVAQPPGKRLQNVLLLSGGEKALTALALLIAIFRFAPSPFCVLDEVDAPLDDANVERFTRLIEEMSSHTQFILITHNKRTMEICRVLYGVTMQEPGVSRLVSVRLEQMEPQAIARPA